MTAHSLLQTLLKIKCASVKSAYFSTDATGVQHLHIHVSVCKRHDHKCPVCGRNCPGYDRSAIASRTWRAPDWNGTIVEIHAQTRRIYCKEHGVHTAAVPWAYHRSGFTKDFDLLAAWLAVNMSHKAVSEFLRIDWATVGKCIERSLNDLEPNRKRRLDNLVKIGIDETSYRKGHKYITVIVNHDTNEVVWIGQGHGKKVLEQFFNMLTPEQRAHIRVVTGDGARWITDCVREWTPDCVRCVDSFHVVQWAIDALDEVRNDRSREARESLKSLQNNANRSKGRPKKDDDGAKAIKEAKANVSELKNCAYAIGMNPENLKPQQRARLEFIRQSDKQLYRAYTLKENLRLLFKETNIEQAKANLDVWLWRASHSRIPAFKELYAKIKRNKEFIMNTIQYGMSNARIEATNNKIKLIIRKAYGFRDMSNLMSMIYLTCSTIEIPLPGRTTNQKQAS